MNNSQAKEKIIQLKGHIDRLSEEVNDLEIQLEHCHFVAFRMADRLERFKKLLTLDETNNPDEVLPGQLPLTTTGPNGCILDTTNGVQLEN